MKENVFKFAETFLPMTSMIVMGILLLYFIWRYFIDAPKAIKPDGHSAPTREVLMYCLIWFALSRALILLVPLRFGDTDALSLNHWVVWDADHYIGIAENWYVNEGDPRLHIVFYPLYPICVRALKYVLFGNTLAAAFIVSNASLLGAGVALFRLVECDMDSAAAHRALRYLMFCPVSLFFSVPYSEALFLLLTVSSALMARRRNMWAAAALGALAAATRMLGLLCAVPIFYEFIRMAKEEGSQPVRRIAQGVLVSMTVTLGFAYYLFLNHQITGNPFQFLIYQSEHWSQEFGSLGNTVKYTIQYMLMNGDIGSVRGTWAPQLVAMVLVLALISATACRTHPSDGAYSLTYYYIALSPTWLLSGARYLGGMYTLYPMLAQITKRRWQDALMMALIIAMGVYVTYMYVVAETLF